MSAPEVKVPLDLSYLYEISDDDREFVQDMILTIVKNTPDSIVEIRAAEQKNDWIEVGRLVHKLKPSLLLLNIDSVSRHIKILEDNAKEEKNPEEAKVQLGELEVYSAIIIKELSEALAKDSY